MTKLYKPMIPTLVEEIPKESDWIYEVKFDGFRCLVYIDHRGIKLISRNLNDLSNSFPEIIRAWEEKTSILRKYLPLVLDGELVILDSPYRANFEKIQVRGRTKNRSKVDLLKEQYPASYHAFDLIVLNGDEIIKEEYLIRKQKLAQLFNDLLGDDNHNLLSRNSNSNLQYVSSTDDIESLWKEIRDENGEGVIAKRSKSSWKEGIRTTDWLKIKNWKIATFIILSLNKQNGYFNVGLVKEGTVQFVGLFSHGLNSDERQALNHIIRTNAIREDQQYIYINPSICIELKFLDWYAGEIRQPRFSKFKLDKGWEDCTWEEAQNQPKI